MLRRRRCKLLTVSAFLLIFTGLVCFRKNSSRIKVVGPEPKAVGPDSEPQVVGPEPKAVGPDSEPQVVGPEPKAVGPDSEPKVVGPEPEPKVVGPDSEPKAASPAYGPEPKKVAEQGLPVPKGCPPQETVTVPVSVRKPSVVSVNEKAQKCDDSLSKRIINPQPYFNKEACCKYARNKSLPELCGVVNETTLGNRSSSSPTCSCIDFMACKMVVLTGISSDHYDEVHDAIGSVQNFHPDVKILVYDLGLLPCQVKHLNSLHNVEVIAFPFKLYPDYVSHLRSYAWKIFGIHAILQKHEIVFWMDASVRLYKPVTYKVLHDLQIFPYRAEMLYGFYDGMYTYDAMYEWFGVTRAQMGKKSQVESGKQFLRNCPFLYEKIYNELLKCANDQSCLEPPGHALICDDMPPERLPNANTRPEDVPNRKCSRYDQSALTIVLHKQFNLTRFSRPVAPFWETLSVWRWYTTCYTVYVNDS